MGSQCLIKHPSPRGSESQLLFPPFRRSSDYPINYMVSEGVCRPFILQSSRQCFYGIWIPPDSPSLPSPWLPGRAQQNGFFGALAQSLPMFLPSQERIKFSQIELLLPEAFVLSSPAKMKSKWPVDPAASMKSKESLSRQLKGLSLTPPGAARTSIRTPVSSILGLWAKIKGRTSDSGTDPKY